MFLLRIIVFIVIVIIALPYIKRGADSVMKAVPGVSKVVNDVTDKVKSVSKQ